MKIINVENLTFSYDGEKTILDKISFDIDARSTVGIIGDSGCGKSTLCHILCGIIPNVIGGRISGSAIVAGKKLRDCNLKDLSQSVGFVFQDSDRQIVTSAVEDELAFGLENLCVAPEEINRKVDEVLDLLDLQEIRTLNPSRLSGGQKQMVAIGSVLIMNPEVIILDEPYSHLDESNRVGVEKIINTLKENGSTVIIVEHDHTMVENADKWMLLENGKIKAYDMPEKVRKYL